MGKIYKNDNGYVFQDALLLLYSGEELLKINIAVFERIASNQSEKIDAHLTSISLKEKEDKTDMKGKCFKAYIETHFYDGNTWREFMDIKGPCKTCAERFERTKEMMGDVRKLLGDGKFGYKREQPEQSI